MSAPPHPPRVSGSVNNIWLPGMLLVGILFLTACQFTKHGVRRNYSYKKPQTTQDTASPSSDSVSEYYRGDDKDIWMKVLVYKGKGLDQKVHNVSLQGNQVLYGGNRYPLEQDQVVFDVDPKDPILLEGHSYFGKVLVAKKSYVYVVNILPLEEYLVGVVRKEISPSWPEEAIKAQAVAARSYAYRKYLENKANPYHLKGNTSDQVFAGTLGAEKSIIKGVQATRGRIMVYDDYPILTFFHASCGGMTEKAKDVWPTSEDLPYFQNIRCNFCTTHPRYSWEYRADVDTVNRKLSEKLGTRVLSFRIERLSSSGRVAEVRVSTPEGNKIISGNEFRLAVGPRELFSTKFKIKRSGNQYFVTGNGYGHGVGLCQWGGKTMAERGYSDDRILNFYYHKIRFSTVEQIEKKLRSSKDLARK